MLHNSEHEHIKYLIFKTISSVLYLYTYTIKNNFLAGEVWQYLKFSKVVCT